MFVDETHLFPRKSDGSKKIELEVSIRKIDLYWLYQTKWNYILQERMNFEAHILIGWIPMIFKLGRLSSKAELGGHRSTPQFSENFVSVSTPRF